ncbi:MAG: hypothetical protein ABR920_02620 [Terriglobales bacterium]
MRQVEITLTFTDQDGTSRPYTLRLQTPRDGTPVGEARVAHHLFSELRVAMRDHPSPKHNSVAGEWLQFPRSKIDFSQFFDVQNSQSLWLELSNLIRGIEHDLEMARAFKELEPAEEPPFEDDAAINNLYFLHDRKMNALDRAVYELIKVQDVINRLLHESLGGDLVDTSKPDWERTELTRKNVEKGLQARLASGALSQSDFDAISAALDIPKSTPHGEAALTYRRKLMHHIHPSVDYAMFFAGLESREGEVMTDATGKIIGRRITMRARPPVQYRFQGLHASLTEYLDAVVAMLQKLSEIEILRR